MTNINLKKNNGVTLVAVIITIIVMLILLEVSVNIAISSKLFEYAKSARDETAIAVEREKKMAEGMITVEGKTYSSIDDYIEGNVLEVVDWDIILANAEKHPSQTSSEYIGVGTDGNPVNMDLWICKELVSGWDLANLIITTIPSSAPGRTKSRNEL